MSESFFIGQITEVFYIGQNLWVFLLVKIREGFLLAKNVKSEKVFCIDQNQRGAGCSSGTPIDRRPEATTKCNSGSLYKQTNKQNTGSTTNKQ